MCWLLKFFDFAGIAFNIGKTKLFAATWAPSDDAGVMMHDVQAEDWRPQMYDLDVLFAEGCLCVRSRSEPGFTEHILPGETSLVQPTCCQCRKGCGILVFDFRRACHRKSLWSSFAVQ